MINKKQPKKILLKKGRIIDPFSKKTFIGDILVENGRIASIRKNITSKDKNIFKIDCKGLVVTHGFCDIHVHFRQPGREDKETLKSGSTAALAGGFTQVCTMPNTNPPIDSPEHIHYIKSKSNNLPIDIFPIGAVSLGQKGEELTEMLIMKENGAIAFSDDGIPIQNAQFMALALKYSKMTNLPVINHAEDIYLRNEGVMNAGPNSNNLGLKGNPNLAESIMVYRDLALASSLGARLHIPHISTKDSVELIKLFKSKSKLITAEVSPHHLYFSDDDIIDFNTNLKVGPPIRSKSDRKKLIEGIKNGTIDCIATDHAPHTIEDKETTFNDAEFGMIGLESCFGVVNKVLVKDNGMSLKSLIEKLTVNPRKIMNINRDLFSIGEKAQITIFDPNEKWTFSEKNIYSKSSNSPFINHDLVGKVKYVFSKDSFFTL
ncbi:MAG: dihydroorotase [Candidatus Neomarinimicrobiota bacterium]|nr:dihydroorotase [Candidatus Neomarinimicrobiota bacterium]